MGDNQLYRWRRHYVVEESIEMAWERLQPIVKPWCKNQRHGDQVDLETARQFLHRVPPNEEVTFHPYDLPDTLEALRNDDPWPESAKGWIATEFKARAHVWAGLFPVGWVGVATPERSR